MEPLDPVQLLYGYSVALIYFWLGRRTSSVRNSRSCRSYAEGPELGPDPAESERT